MATGELSTHNIKDIEYHRQIAEEQDTVVVSPRVTLNNVILSKFIRHLLPSTHHELILRLGKSLNPGGTLFISEPRKIVNTSLPQKISEWNSSSIVPNLYYSCDAREPGEEHIDENKFLTISKKFNLNIIKNPIIGKFSLARYHPHLLKN